jgi:6-pyruvoyltetrahydropterin/6-carboxytetrahydropterin synthase
MIYLTLTDHFSAAHYLKNYDGKCKNLHGHTWVVDVELVGKISSMENGILLDFTELKPLVKSILPDHQLLNDVVDFNPTAENLVVWLCQELAKKLLEINFKGQINSVTLWESDKARVRHHPVGSLHEVAHGKTFGE